MVNANVIIRNTSDKYMHNNSLLIFHLCGLVSSHSPNTIANFIETKA